MFWFWNHHITIFIYLRTKPGIWQLVDSNLQYSEFGRLGGSLQTKFLLFGYHWRSEKLVIIRAKMIYEN